MAENIYGIDILENNIKVAMKKYPTMHFQHGDAGSMPFENKMFDLVCGSTMFVQILNDNLSRKISAEMIRTTKPKGYLMLSDWRYNKPGHQEYKALSKKRLTNLFNLGNECHLRAVFKGSLVGQVTYVIQRQC